MSPDKKSIFSIIIICSIFTALLYISERNQQVTPEEDFSAAKTSAQQLSDRLSQNLSALRESLKSLAFNTYWQSAPVAEWPYWLNTQKPLYQAAGLSLLGVHSVANDILSIQEPSRPGKFFELTKPLERLYQVKKELSLLQLYKGSPSIIILSPIKDVENQIIGALVGIKYLDKETLKGYHHLTKVPVAIINSGEIKAQSIDNNIDLLSFNAVNVTWPEEINSSLWQLSLLVQPPSSFSLSLVFLALGGVLTFVLAMFVNKQINRAKNASIQLRDCLDIQLPIAEQIIQLTNLHNNADDPILSESAQGMRSRLEKSVQHAKSLNMDIRKLKEEVQQLKHAASSLSHERDTAIAAPRLKSEFLSRMGDEITTPMKSVVSMLKLLSEYQLEAEAKQILNIAKRSTRTLVDNLNNILDFSKLDANMLKLSTRHFSVRELVDDLSSELSHYANEKGLSLQASSDPELPSEVSADQNRIKQILRNLLGNAVRFTKSGEVNLYADIIHKDDMQFLRFTVKDSGVGIPLEAQKGLFDSLEQSTKLNNSSFAGRLRLIVSKNLAELMGGEIGVISETGKGSQFWFTILLD